MSYSDRITLRMIKGDLRRLGHAAARETCSTRKRPLLTSRLTRARSRFFCFLNLRDLFIPAFENRIIQTPAPGKPGAGLPAPLACGSATPPAVAGLAAAVGAAPASFSFTSVAPLPRRLRR